MAEFEIIEDLTEKFEFFEFFVPKILVTHFSRNMRLLIHICFHIISINSKYLCYDCDAEIGNPDSKHCWNPNQNITEIKNNTVVGQVCATELELINGSVFVIF